MEDATQPITHPTESADGSESVNSAPADEGVPCQVETGRPESQADEGKNGVPCGDDDDEDDDGAECNEIKPMSETEETTEDEPLTAPFIGSGTGWQYEDMRKHDGLFVILRAADEITESGRVIQDSKKDLERFMDLFSLKREDSNLILDDRVVPDGKSSISHNEIRFKQFLERILSYREEFSFLCMLIVAHGFEDGSFMLSGGHRDRDACCDKKVKSKHKFDENCEFRRTYEDVIEKIEDKQQFLGKPKVFFVETCRGPKEKDCIVEVKSAQDHTAPPSRYIPAHSDTLIMYACYDGYKAERMREGHQRRMLSLMVDELHQVGKAVLKDACKYEPRLQKITPTAEQGEEQEAVVAGGASKVLNKINKIRSYFSGSPTRKSGEGDSKLPPRLRRQLYCVESYTGGWLMDVCRAVTHQVSLREPRTGKNEKILYRQQPVIWSTLRDNVSFMNMMERKRQKRSSKSSSK